MNLNKIFSSNMVFSAGKPIKIYGEGNGEVEIFFADYYKKIVSQNNSWIVEFPAMEYGGPYELKAVFNDKTVILDNIFIGEVYLLAGQSNVQFKMGESTTATEEYVSNDRIRLFSTNRLESGERYNAYDGWKTCKLEEIKYWSAIGYLTAKEIAETKNVAVGIITCYQGASVIESWVPKGTFEKIGINIPVSEKFIDHTNELFSDWNGDGVLYEYALSQVVPFSLSGIVWYQGESDAAIKEAQVYKEEVLELINVWRAAFDDKTLPFIVVQIADYDARATEAWALIQKAQYDVQFILDNVKTVISADVCEKDDIHPPTKIKLAKRIAIAMMQFIDK